ncbi:MAG: ABC transporter permease subunit [Synechococcaceae cyanobacterium]|nr:ABC transporter permease subunit [Synechococcaceae cyanobacterium]
MRRLLRGRGPLAAGVLVICLLALLPVAALLGFSLTGDGASRPDLGPTGQVQLGNTVLLVLAVGGLGGVLGTTTGWLTAACRFPGRRWLAIAQLLPLATPAYLLAATLVDLGSRAGWRVHGMGWTVLVLTLSTYSYVFLLSRESFSIAGRRLLEAARSLGVGPWGGFRRVALPLALPAIGAGIALTGMEVVNELGAVELLGVPTLSSGILQRWQNEGDPRGAAALALLALLLVSLLVAAERRLRRRSRRWSLGAQEGLEPWPLSGWRAAAAVAVTVVPPLLALGAPLLWAGLSLEQMRGDAAGELAVLAVRSFGLALLAALLTVLAGLLLAIAKRWIPQPLLTRLTFVAGMGYAVPGAVLALALMLLGGPLALSPLLLLVWGYSDRFLAVAKGGLDAGLERLPPSVDEAATVLGCDWLGVLGRVHLPLLRGPLIVGALLVFVDTVKELPLTFALRPFDFDTLAVRVYQYASDERVGEALVPALLILLLGLAAALALVPTLERRR